MPNASLSGCFPLRMSYSSLSGRFFQRMQQTLRDGLKCSAALRPIPITFGKTHPQASSRQTAATLLRPSFPLPVQMVPADSPDSRYGYCQTDFGRIPSASLYQEHGDSPADSGVPGLSGHFQSPVPAMPLKMPLARHLPDSG